MAVKTPEITKFTGLRLGRIEKNKSKKNWLLVEGYNEFIITDDEAEATARRAHIPGHVEHIRAYGQDDSTCRCREGVLQMRKSAFCLAALAAAGLSAAPASKAQSWSGNQAIYMTSDHLVNQTWYGLDVTTGLFLEPNEGL
jgi:hypothetical protein